ARGRCDLKSKMSALPRARERHYRDQELHTSHRPPPGFVPLGGRGGIAMRNVKLTNGGNVRNTTRTRRDCATPRRAGAGCGTDERYRIVEAVARLRGMP